MGGRTQTMNKAAIYAEYGIVEKIVREPMPLGGFGFRCAVFHHGQELKNGVLGIAGVMQQARQAAAKPIQ